MLQLRVGSSIVSCDSFAYVFFSLLVCIPSEYFQNVQSIKTSSSNLFLLHCTGYLLSVQSIKYVKKNKETI
jgi:hypothetical protein